MISVSDWVDEDCCLVRETLASNGKSMRLLEEKGQKGMNSNMYSEEIIIFS